MTRQESDRPGYMRWFFPALLGFFITLAIALLILWWVPGLWPWATTGIAAADQELLAEAHRTEDLRAELALLERDLEQRLAICVVPEPLAWDPVQEPEEVAMPDWDLPEQPPVEVAEAEPEPEPEPVVEPEPEPVVEPEPEPDADHMDNLPEPEPQYEPGPDELDIPDDAERTGNLDFLEGCWISETGLTNRDTGQPVTVRYCFDANGNGSREVLDIRGPCQGRATARMRPDGSLAIDIGEAPCSFGDVAYVDGLVVCTEGTDGKTHCNGQGGGVHWRSHFTRERYAAPGY